ncbi:hypothetical protein PG985_012826 [Apiospora marii]|uniref:uncharacterized protein n=1 Tax=Apiospora marii TaxID=335849 RepID=UPI003130C2A1
MHPGTPAPPPAIYQVPHPMPPPSPAPVMQFADVKQPQPVVMQQQYPGIPTVGSPPPPFQQQHPTQQMVGPVQPAPAATMPVYNQAQSPAHGHGAHLSPWSAPIFDCFNPADQLFMACFCPCIVFGKTRARLRDPSMATYDTVNSDWTSRKEIRARYAIKGDSAEDAMLTLCCPVCALVQEEKEVVRRTAQQAVQQPPPTGYMAQPPMHMSPMQVQMQMQSPQ